MYMKNKSGICLVLVALFLGSCSAPEKKTTVYREQRILMGTLVCLTSSGVEESRAKKVFSEAFDLATRLEGLFSRKSKEIKALQNGAGSGVFSDISPEILYVIKKAKYYHRISKGMFDITILPVLELWGFADTFDGNNEGYELPKDSRIKGLLPLVDANKLHYDEIQKKAYLEKKGMKLDLGGISKGFIIDRVSDYLKSKGVTNFIIDAGGDMMVSGKKEEKKEWKIGIQDPWDQRSIAASLISPDMAVATSGNYQRYFIKDNRRYHHIISPKTGYPAGEISSVTVVANTALDADSLATTAFLLGAKEGMKLIENLPNVEGIIITQKKKYLASSGIIDKHKLTLTTKSITPQ